MRDPRAMRLPRRCRPRLRTCRSMTSAATHHFCGRVSNLGLVDQVERDDTRAVSDVGRCPFRGLNVQSCVHRPPRNQAEK